MRWWFGLIIPCCFTFIGATEAADCPGTDLRFTSDDEVKAYFSSDSAQGCDVITGDITFSGPAITDVFWFRYFYRVEGRLTIDSTSVPDFLHFSPTPDTRGLEFVKELRITNNPQLTRLRGLHGLASSETERIQSVEVTNNSSLDECYQIAGLMNGPLRMPSSGLHFSDNLFGCNSIREIKASGLTTLGHSLGEPLTATTELGESFGLGQINLNYAYRAALGKEVRDNILVIIGETGGLSSLTAVPVSLFNVQTSSGLADITQTVNPSLIDGLIVRDTLVADFTGDGLDDIFLNAHGTEGVIPFPGYQNKLMVQNQDGYFEFEQARLPEITDFSHGSDFGDLDGDGDIDLFINNLGDDEGNPSYLLLNDGDGFFMRIPNDTSGPYFDSSAINSNGPFSLILDMDADGDNDIFTGQGHAGQMSAGYLENREGTFFFQPDDVFSSVYYPGAFAYRKIDFNRDGLLDILIVGDGNDYVPSSGATLALHLFENQGQNGFKEVTAAKLHTGFWGQLKTGYGYDVDVLDINGDGHQDFEVRTTLVSSSRAFRLTFFNDRQGGFLPPILDFSSNTLVDFGGVTSARGVYVDINDDGVMDYAYMRDYPQKVAVQIGYVPSPSRPEPPEIAEVDFTDGELLVSVNRSPWVFEVDAEGNPVPPYFEISCASDAGTFTGIGTSSSVSISGAVPDVSYTCTATESNSSGTSEPSQPSKPFMAEEVSAGIPVWLLYEASRGLN